MKAVIKKKIAALLNSAQRAEAMLLRLCRGGNTQEAVRQREQLAGDMQQAAIGAGQTIEELEGKGGRTVALLEAYCEELWQFTQAGSARQRREKAEQVAALGMQARAMLEEEYPVSFHVVFLPYKASMWDSMESVWQALRREEQVQVHVVPVPYYTKKANGETDELVWEKKLYPPYVETEDYREIDLQALQPDAIVIHNPYDDGNTVTTVDPAFYSDKLKQYTDFLVYIPYYVSGEDMGADFCFNKGILNADCVILQNHHIAERIYLRQYRFFLEGRADALLTPAALARKFQVLGSPKADAMYHRSKDDYPIPEEWRQMIRNKKVVLYNTSLGGLLSGGGAALQKMRAVLDFFRDSSEYAVWWRPHPLSKATYAGILPQLRAEYEELVRRYREEKIGIYDETPDPLCAMMYGDMYYGTTSGLTWQFGLTGRPLVYQTMACAQGDGEQRGEADGVVWNTRFSAACRCGKLVYFWAYGYNGLYSVNPEDGKAVHRGAVPGAGGIAEQLYTDMVQKDGLLYLVPGSADQLAVYDTKQGSFEVRELPVSFAHGSRKFSRGIMLGDTLCLLPAEEPYFVTINVRNRHTFAADLEERRQKLTGEAGGRPGRYTVPNAAVLGESLFFVLAETGLIAEYRPKADKLTVMRLPVAEEAGEEKELAFAASWQGELYLASAVRNKPYLYRWDRRGGRLVRVWIQQTYGTGGDILLMETTEKGICIVPASGGTLCLLRPEKPGAALPAGVGTLQEKAQAELLTAPENEPGDVFGCVLTEEKGGLLAELSNRFRGEARPRLAFLPFGDNPARSVPVVTEKRDYAPMEVAPRPGECTMRRAIDFFEDDTVMDFEKVFALSREEPSKWQKEAFERLYANAGGHAGEAIAAHILSEIKGEA